MKGLRTLVIGTTALVLLSGSGFVAYAVANHQVQAPVVKHAAAPTFSVPTWFLQDVQLAERAKLKSGINYMLNYGETNVPFSLQLNQVWFGTPTNISKNPFFGYSWSGVYQNVKIQPQALSSINVLEQAQQGGNTVGVLVSAKSMPINNGAFIAFANGQVITAADKSGEFFYTVYPVKAVSVPLTNQSGSSSATPSGYGTHDSGLIEKTYPTTVAALGAINRLQLESSGQFISHGPATYLGLGIKAQYWSNGEWFGYEWQEGRWTILTQFWGKANTPVGVKVAKNMVAFLHTHMLPAPQNKGIIVAAQPSISSSVDYVSNTIAWQVGNHVYELKETGNPVTALKNVVIK